jgi:hypothetical protein
MAVMLLIVSILGPGGPAIAFDGDGHLIEQGPSPWRV